MSRVKFDYNQRVKFVCNGKENIGIIFIIDAYGILRHPAEVSYDIKGDDNIISNHIMQSDISEIES